MAASGARRRLGPALALRQRLRVPINLGTRLGVAVAFTFGDAEPHALCATHALAAGWHRNADTQRRRRGGRR